MINKLLFLLCLLAVVSTGQAQSSGKYFHLTGDIKGLETSDGYIYLQGFLHGKFTKDSTKVIDGHFEFTDSIEPMMAQLLTHRVGAPRTYNTFSLFTDSGNVSVTAVYDTSVFSHIRDVVVKGSRANDEYDAFMDAGSRIRHQGMDLKTWNAAYLTARNNNDTARMRALTETPQPLNDQVERMTEQYYRDHPRSPVCLYFIVMNAPFGQYASEKGLRRFAQLDPALQSSALGKWTVDRLNTVVKGQLVGKPAGNIALPDTSGKIIHLSDFKGKYVLVDFWASWCGPCRMTAKKMMPVYDRYKDKGFQVLAVSLDEKAAAWKKAIIEDHITWPAASDSNGVKGETAKSFGVVLLPTTFLIDPNGIVLERNIDPATLEEKLKVLLKK